MSACVKCRGEQVLRGLGCPGMVPIALPCPWCEGTGVAPKWQADAIAKGEVLSRHRRQRNRSLREEAKSDGISAVLASKIETGRLAVAEWPEHMQLKVIALGRTPVEGARDG